MSARVGAPAGREFNEKRDNRTLSQWIDARDWSPRSEVPMVEIIQSSGRPEVGYDSSDVFNQNISYRSTLDSNKKMTQRRRSNSGSMSQLLLQRSFVTSACLFIIAIQWPNLVFKSISGVQAQAQVVEASVGSTANGSTNAPPSATRMIANASMSSMLDGAGQVDQMTMLLMNNSGIAPTSNGSMQTPGGPSRPPKQAPSSMAANYSRQHSQPGTNQSSALGGNSKAPQAQTLNDASSKGQLRPGSQNQQASIMNGPTSNSPAYNSRARQHQAPKSMLEIESEKSAARSRVQPPRPPGAADIQLATNEAPDSQEATVATRDRQRQLVVAPPGELDARSRAKVWSSGDSSGSRFQPAPGKTAAPQPAMGAQWQTVSSASIASAPGGWLAMSSRPVAAPSLAGADSGRSDKHLRAQATPQQALGGQLERPAGYSYAATGGSYTHTSELSPARLETMIAEQATGATKQHRRQHQLEAFEQQRQYYAEPPRPLVAPVYAAEPGAGPRLAEQQQQVGVARLAPAVSLPHFGASGAQPSGASGAPPPQPQPVGATGSLCRPPAHWAAGGQSQQQQQIEVAANELVGSGSAPGVSQLEAAKFVRVGEGTRLRSQFIFKVLRADSLTDCELACARSSSAAAGDQHDSCRTFNFRPYFAAENCELSRHEARHLRPADSAQFERNTQFDFYALDTLAAGPANQISGAQLADLPECLDVSQACSSDGMDFTLKTLEPFTGRIYTYGFYESCFQRGDGSLTNRLHISRANGFPRCGTQQVGDLMTNLVVVQFSEHVQTTRDRKYNLTCYFSGPGESVVTSSYLDTKLEERSRPIQVEHLPPQNVITSNVQLRVLYRGQPTNAIAVGDLLTFRLETNNGAAANRLGRLQGPTGSDYQQPHMEIFATNVIAKDPYSGRQVQLIDARGCPVDPINVFPELQRTPDGALESEFYAFKIPDSSFLIFQATVRTCRAPCEPVICQTSPTASGRERPHLTTSSVSSGVKGSLGAYLMAPHQSSAPSWGKRRRRRDTNESGVNLSVRGSDEGDERALSQDSLVSDESVEHIIPVRLEMYPNHQQAQQTSITRPPRQMITRIRKQPVELGEAEEEVKEMFRVYMSRAELRKQQELKSQTDEKQTTLLELNHNDQLMLTTPASESTSQNSKGALADTWNQASDGSPSFQELTTVAQVFEQQVCMTYGNYYVMLFAIISLSLIVSSTLFVFVYVSRRAKFHINNTLADPIF